jgi:uncharacterized protein YdaU (DUF1376 family)
MNYYRRNLGDYARDTKHLSMLEHGAFNQLLDTLYATETPLPDNEKLLWKICSASTKRERNAVKSVLSQFFFRKPSGFSNKRFERELKHLKSRAKVAKQNGSKGGRPRKQKANAKLNETHEKATPDSILQTLDSNINKEKSGGAAAFIAIGFDKPFGQPQFQAIWAKHFEIATAAGEWLTQAMEDTAQECQTLKVGIPPQFFTAKREVESREMAEFERKYHRTPL